MHSVEAGKKFGRRILEDEKSRRSEVEKAEGGKTEKIKVVG